MPFFSLPPGQFENGYIDQLFLNQLCFSDDAFFKEIEGLKVSSHVVIDRSGKITQFVDFDQKAWHAGVSQFQGRKACNDFSIGIELEGTDERPYTQQQYERLIEVIHALYKAYPKTENNPIVGHCHIAPGRKTDPGASFDWELLKKQGLTVWEG